MDEDRVQFPDGPLIWAAMFAEKKLCGRLILARSVRSVRFPFGPLTERKVRRDQRTAALVSVREDLEQ